MVLKGTNGLKMYVHTISPPKITPTPRPKPSHPISKETASTSPLQNPSTRLPVGGGGRAKRRQRPQPDQAQAHGEGAQGQLLLALPQGVGRGGLQRLPAILAPALHGRRAAPHHQHLGLQRVRRGAAGRAPGHPVTGHGPDQHRAAQHDAQVRRREDARAARGKNFGIGVCSFFFLVLFLPFDTWMSIVYDVIVVACCRAICSRHRSGRQWIPTKFPITWST